MSDDIERRFAQLAAAAAPPQRDPYFRLKLMERQEQARFKAQLRLSLAALGCVAVFGGVVLILHPATLWNPAVLALGMLVSAAGLACAYPLARRLI